MQFNLKYQIKISCLITDLQAVKKSNARGKPVSISVSLLSGGGGEGLKEDPYIMLPMP